MTQSTGALVQSNIIRGNTTSRGPHQTLRQQASVVLERGAFGMVRAVDDLGAAVVSRCLGEPFQLSRLVHLVQIEIAVAHRREHLARQTMRVPAWRAVKFEAGA